MFIYELLAIKNTKQAEQKTFSLFFNPKKRVFKKAIPFLVKEYSLFIKSIQPFSKMTLLNLGEKTGKMSIKKKGCNQFNASYSPFLLYRRFHFKQSFSRLEAKCEDGCRTGHIEQIHRGFLFMPRIRKRKASEQAYLRRSILITKHSQHVIYIITSSRHLIGIYFFHHCFLL